MRDLQKEYERMVEKQSLIAYTVMVQRTDGKWMFLVQQDLSDFVFPGIQTVNNMNSTGLSSVIEVLKRDLDLNFNKLELIELTNAIYEKERLPLFVFKYHCGTQRPSQLLLPHSNLEWQVSDRFKETIQRYEISGVPLF